MSKELDRARNLCARRPIPIGIRQLMEPLEAAAPESESEDFAELHAIIDALLPLDKPKPKRKKDAKSLRTEEEHEEKEKANEEVDVDNP